MDPKDNISIHSDKGEKTHHDQTGIDGHLITHALDINELGADGQSLQTAPDGKTILIPQPSGDPYDPLNWDPLKKNVTLWVLALLSALPEFGSSMGIIALLPQAVYVTFPKYR